MTTKIEYLKKCVQDLKVLEDYTWYINALGVPVGFTQLEASNVQHLQLVLKPEGLHYADHSVQEPVFVKIDDYVKDEPLFLPRQQLEIDSSWVSNCQDKITTNIGRLLVNAVAIAPVFGQRVPYFNTQISISQIESTLALRMVHKDKFTDPKKQVTVDEYLECIDRAWFFTKVSKLVTVAASPKIITAPPGIDKLRAKLLQENKDNLNDPVVVASITNTLNDYDKDYLKDDMSAKLILQGNSKGNTARKKMYQIYGEYNDFNTNENNTPILTSMDKGFDTSDDVFPKYMNDLRYASYSRGHSTALAGYTYKILQRSLSGFEVTDQDCMTTKGLVRVTTKANKLLNRYVQDSGKWVLVDTVESTGKYLGKVITVRSPMYCQSKNNTICYKCLGENYKGVKNAINNIAATFSGELLRLFLKRMHTSGFTLTAIDSQDLIT